MFIYLFACTGSTEKPTPDPIDLVSTLSEDEVRAGQITDQRSLFGGVSSEGRIGDYKLYNNKTQFIIQSIRTSNYYIQEGGGVLDADIIRPENQIGRDVIDEHSPMIGIGRILDPSQITVIDDGSSGTAHIQVQGTGIPFALIEGTLESYDLVPDMEHNIQVDYRLRPDSYLLEIETTVTWNDDNAPIQPANILLVGKEVTEVWNPGEGLLGNSNSSWYGLVGQQNEVALGLFPSEELFSASSFQSLLEDATPAMTGFDETILIEDGDIISMKHFLGVGRELADLTDEFYEQKDVETEEFSGVISSNNEVVAGARVQLFSGSEAITMAITNEDGSWSANVPTGQEISYIASGRGHAKHYDLPSGAGWYPAYGDQDVLSDTVASLESGAVPVPFAEGYGIAEWNSNELIAPGIVTVTTSDGLPAVVLIAFAQGDTITQENLVPGRPSGYAAIGYIRDGQIDIPVEPGDYTVYVHRGLMCEYTTQSITLTSQGSQTINADIGCTALPENVYSIDPHSHSSPSGDGKISMAGRIITHAAYGINYHVSTEHDHIIDFNPLINALDLTGTIQSIIGSEVSPTLKGHHNSYPLIPDPTKTNFGSPLWWDKMRTTPELYEIIREVQPENGIIQANHPTGTSGLFTAADWDLASGIIFSPTYWDSSFTAMEIINDGSYSNYVPRYFDLISRGYQVTPVGVSDSHSNSGGVGETATFVFAQENTSDAIIDAMNSTKVIPSNGPYIHATIDGEYAPGQTFNGVKVLDVVLFHPSWMNIETVALYENGIEVQSIPYESEAISFDLSPDVDSHYSVIAKGSESQSPISSNSPWAISAALKIDLAGDGWEAPLPPLQE
jgi:hypothetical protein